MLGVVLEESFSDPLVIEVNPRFNHPSLAYSTVANTPVSKTECWLVIDIQVKFSCLRPAVTSAIATSPFNKLHYQQ